MRKEAVMKKIVIPKINSVFFGSKLLCAGLMVGVIIPFLAKLLFHVFLWPLCIVGGIILFVFAVLFIIEMFQDFGKKPYYEKRLKEEIPYNSEEQTPVIRCSICTGEKIAGFKNKSDGHFTEVMLIKTYADEENFKKIYGLDEIKKEY